MEDRVAALEKQCDRMNSDIAAIRAIVDVLNQADFIKGVTPVKDGGKVVGYMLEFRNSPSVTIYCGADGKDAPVIGIRKDGDAYYWTLDGEWLLDDEGNRIKVNGNDGRDGADGHDGQDGQDGRDGVTPQLKIEDGCWWVSYDNGASWEKLGDEAPVMVKEIREDSNYVYITLYSGTEIRLPKVGSVISFEDPTVKTICVKHWDVNKDGELSYDEAAAVRSLGDVFQGMGILYFNELAYFTGLEAIDDAAFYKSGIQEVKVPSTLKSIGANAFFATPLESISIPESVESVGSGAFYACRYLQSANIPSSLTEVPAKLFAGCWKLKSIELPAGTTKIGEQAFLECYELADVEWPVTLDTLENNAFSQCKAFTEVVLPSTVGSVGYSCFYGCENASSIVFPEGVEVLDHMVVYGCSAMESFTVPSTVTSIGWFVFWGCSGMTSLIMQPVVPPSVRTDNSGASTLFSSCSPDLKIYVPDVEAYESDPYWSRYTGMFLPME